MNTHTGMLGALWAWLVGLPTVALVTLLICGLYAISVIAARWLLVANPVRKVLESTLEDMESQVKLAEATHPSAPTIASVRELLDKARAHYNAVPPFKWFTWSGEDELATWHNIHSADRMLVSLWSEAAVSARLVQVAADLKSLQQSTPTGTADSGYAGLLTRIQDALTREPKDADQQRLLLERALDALHSETDFQFWEQTNRYAKAMWMAGSAILLILAITLALGGQSSPVFFLVGAVGGFMSRLSRTLRTGQGKEYDFWTTLFLSPLLGALTGWAGVLLLHMGTQLGVLGDSFAKVDWHYPSLYSTSNVVPLAAAFLFGFSERFFNGVVSKLENTTQPKDAGPGSTGTTNTSAAGTGTTNASAAGTGTTNAGAAGTGAAGTGGVPAGGAQPNAA